jgi:(2Fe-2S) ferredoxin
MEKHPKTFAICVNTRYGSDKPSCGERGSIALAEAVEKGVRERRIDVTIERLVCFGLCTMGPNMRLVPGGAFRHGVAPKDIAAILDELERECGTRPAEDEPPAHLLGS